MRSNLIPSLYVHFPFCESKCHYCDFYSLGKERTKTEDPVTFENALLAEANQFGHLLAPELETIFFGGGTPSMTTYESMARSLEPLWKHTCVTSQTEWTMEANPSSITLEAFKQYRAFGINRISMGVQAMRPDLLKALGRVHSREAVFLALEAVFEAGFENVSVDLLCGVPQQKEEDLLGALDTLTQFPIQHLSCYLLTLPPHHRMYKDLPDEDTQLAHLLLVDQWMSAKGFEHYEISNYAKPTKQARHNLNYWKGCSYLGLGPSAHSYDATTQRRWKNVSSLHKYASLLHEKKSPIEWTETLSQEQLELERWMLGLRLSEGFPTDWLNSQLRRSRAKIFQDQGLLEFHPHDSQRLRLTSRGFALSDQIIRSLA
jgi:oxygen-independent coproporphyrinogen-3 oxidase